MDKPSRPRYAIAVRLSVVLVLGVLLFQGTASPLLVTEDCLVQELRHADDDCPPLCVTCACSAIGHAFQPEVSAEAVAQWPSLGREFRPADAAPEAPPHEILHVPLI